MKRSLAQDVKTIDIRQKIFVPLAHELLCVRIVEERLFSRRVFQELLRNEHLEGQPN